MKVFAVLASAISAYTTADFNGRPAGDARPCNFYTMKATANFGDGFTESVENSLIAWVRTSRIFEYKISLNNNTKF